MPNSNLKNEENGTGLSLRSEEVRAVLCHHIPQNPSKSCGKSGGFGAKKRRFLAVWRRMLFISN